MKTKDFILIGVVGIVGYFLYKSTNASAYSIIPRETMPVYAIESVNTQGRDEIGFFNSTSKGVEAMNEITSKGGKLKRTSQTLKILGKNDTIAKLGDGSIKRVTVNAVKTDSSGKSAIDKIIAKNTASKTSVQLARKKSVK